MKRLRKYFALTPGARAIVLRSLLLLPLVAVMLRVRGMARTTAWLERIEQYHRGGHTGALPPSETARLVNAVASFLRVRCLPRSMVLLHSLGSRGTSAAIRFGVARRVEGGLSAHAWVELDGRALIDGPGVFKRYAAFPSTVINSRG